MSVTLESAAFMKKDYLDNCHSITNTTLKQMFDISEKLVSEQSDEIYGVKTTNWESSSWKYLSLIGDERVINLQCTNTSFRILYCVLVRLSKSPIERCMGTKIGMVKNLFKITET